MTGTMGFILGTLFGTVLGVCLLAILSCLAVASRADRRAEEMTNRK